MMTKDGIIVDVSKVTSVRYWDKPNSPTEILGLFRLAVYYRWFVQCFSSIETPLSKLTQMKIAFQWSNN